MPVGDPAALEEAAGNLRGYAGQIATLSESTRSTTGQIATNADWTGSSADAYTAFSGSFATGMEGMQAPLRSVPGAVAGYASALRDAQAKVTDYETYAQQVNSFVGPVSTQEQAQITAQAQQLMSTAQTALDGLEQAAKDAESALKSIGNELDDVFAVEGPFHTWLETITRPWDAVSADAILEGVIQHGEELESARLVGDTGRVKGRRPRSPRSPRGIDAPQDASVFAEPGARGRPARHYRWHLHPYLATRLRPRRDAGGRAGRGRGTGARQCGRPRREPGLARCQRHAVAPRARRR